MSLRDESREQYKQNGEIISLQELKTGCLQRIADAVERMCVDRVKLERDVDMYKKLWTAAVNDRDQLERSNAALRGVVTRRNNEIKRLRRPEK